MSSLLCLDKKFRFSNKLTFHQKNYSESVKTFILLLDCIRINFIYNTFYPWFECFVKGCWILGESSRIFKRTFSINFNNPFENDPTCQANTRIFTKNVCVRNVMSALLQYPLINNDMIIKTFIRIAQTEAQTVILLKSV